jgi:hypothetical protein
MKTLKLVLSIALSCFALTHANAQQQVQVTFENLQAGDGFYLTPIFAGFHDGSFDVFDAGSAASLGLEQAAEDGMFATLQNDFTAAAPSGQQALFTSPGGFPGAPVFDPGESVSQVFNLDTNSRFLNFATMLLPTNDNFLGNGNAIAILDAAGAFNGNQTFDLTLANVWDAGTEENNGIGLPFSPPVGADTPTVGGVVSLIDPATDLAAFEGLATANGTNINLASAGQSPVLRVSITAVNAVPEPSSLALLGAFGVAGLVRRRR